MPPSASLGKSSDMAGTDPVANPPGCTGTRVGMTGPTPLISGRQSAKSVPTGASVPDDPFLLIPGQSQDYLVEISSSREPSPVVSSTSSWINLDSDSSGLGGYGSNGTQDVSMKKKLLQLEKTVASLQAQLQAPTSTTPKVASLML